MGIITLSNVSLSFGVDEILKPLSFTVNSGTKLGIIGANGAGKTSLFKIISGEISPSSGNIFVQSGIRIGVLKQQNDDMLRGNTVYEYIFSAIKDEYKSKAAGVLKKLSFPEETHSLPAKMLSGGQKTRLALASVLLSDYDVILLDEPTNHLDIETTQWLETVICSSKKTFMIISHDRYFLDKTTTRTLEIENGVISMYEGGYSVFRDKKDKLVKDMQKHYLLQQKEIKRLEAFIENQRKWNRERNIIAAESRQKAIDRMVKLDRPAFAPSAIKFKIAASPKGSNDVLSVRKITKGYGGEKLFSSLSFELKRGERLFIIGANGTGKSTLIKLLTGRITPDDGTYEYGYNQKIGYYDQEQQLLNEAGTVIEELWDCYETLTQTQVRTALASFGFINDDVFKPVSVLSGGERARLSICKLILSGISLLILDEPTNHLDIASKETLENAINEYDGTVLAVSHDRYFIKSLATDIIEINKNEYESGYAVYKCGYDDYITKRSQFTKVSAKDNQKESKSDEYAARKKAKSEMQRRAKRLEALKELIPLLEAEEVKVKSQIDGEYSTDYEKLQQLYQRCNEISDELIKLYDEFFELSEE